LKGPPFCAPQPHVVILGAGASKAAFLDGDRNGKSIPLLDDLPDIIGEPWKELVIEARPPFLGFESQYSWIKSRQTFSEKLLKIEELVYQYFNSLEILDCPTIYDYLVLGLQKKDVIATFNWDPFLMLAYRRNRTIAKLPDIRFLHGCVAFATCPQHDILGSPSEKCPECEEALVQSQLFFPEQEKDYTKDALIQRDWLEVTKKLKNAFHLTIYGYAGPVTDYKARELLLDGWKEAPLKKSSHVEIINIEDEQKLRENWAEFIPFFHDMITNEFWSSTIARWPRRTAEYKLSASRYGIPAEYLGPFRTDSLQELQHWFSELAESEEQ
jgi:hypothetical protein